MSLSSWMQKEAIVAGRFCQSERIRAMMYLDDESLLEYKNETPWILVNLDNIIFIQ